MNHSLRFVGCGDGLSDPNFKPFLPWLRGVNAHNQAHHFRVVLAPRSGAEGEGRATVRERSGAGVIEPKRGTSGG